MFCTNCGAQNVGDICPNCNVSTNSNAKSKGFDLKRVFQNAKVVIPVLAVLLVGASASGVFAYQQNQLVIKHQKLETAALEAVDTFNASAAKFDDLAASAKVSRDACYINWYCSASLYGEWISLVNTDESLAESMRSSAADSQAEADKEHGLVVMAEKNRTVGISLASVLGVFFIAVAALTLVFRRKKA